MSVCRKLPDGTVQKIAGHTILLDANASEVREGQASFTTPAAGTSVVCTFSDPMPDTDYKVILEYPFSGQSWGADSTPADVAVHSKTTTGFTLTMWPVGQVSQVYINWTAFKLIKLDGYTALQNKVNNPDEVPTEDSENLVKSGGVWEAIENNKNTLKFNNVVVLTSAWVADATYSDFGFKAVINCTDVTSDYMADVVFDCDDATSGTFAPVSSTGAGTVTIYANSVPNSDITIPTILCTK